MIKSRIFVVLLFKLLFISTLFSQSNELLSTQNRLKFGDYLFRQKDYLRAVFEYQNILQNSINDTVKFKLAFCLEKMDRFNEASDNYKGLMFNSDLEDLAKIFFLKNQFVSNDILIYQNLAGSAIYSPKQFTSENEKLIKYSMFYGEKTFPKVDEFLTCFDESDKGIISNFYLRKHNPKNKDVWTAGILSALLPGAGKVYTEEYTDGITSFLLTGIFTYLAVDNLNDGHDTRGWIFTGLATYFYAGNIYGSIASAQIFNAKIEFDLMDEINKFLGKKNYFLPQVDFLQ